MNKMTPRPVPATERFSAAFFTPKGIRLEAIAHEGPASTMPEALSADALIVLIDPSDDAAFAAITSRARLPVAPPVIAAVSGLTVNDTRRLMRAGVADVLPAPFTSQDLAMVMEPLRNLPRKKTAGSEGQVVSFFGTGGSGSTSLSVQAGVELAKGARVCLIDLDVQRGTAALQLDMKPPLSLMDLISSGERLDASVLQSVTVDHASGLALVASAPEILPLDDLTPENVDRIIDVAKRQYAIVLVDLPAEWTDWKVRVLELSDLALLVTRPNVVGVHRTNRILPLLDGNNLSDRVQLVANRVQRSLFREASLDEQESVLKRGYAYKIADDAEGMATATEQGKSLAEARSGSRLLKDVKALAGGIEERLHILKAAQG